MSLRYTAASSSRITKPRSKNPLLRRSTQSPFNNHARRKPVERSKTDLSDVANKSDEDEDENLGDLGLVICLGIGLNISNSLEAMQYVQSSIFTKLPERAGMNSVRIAEVLNYQRSFPPVVSVVHIHTLLFSPTATEKELASLVRTGKIRRITVSVQGPNGTIEEGMVFASDWHGQIDRSAHLAIELKEKFHKLLNQCPGATRFSRDLFTTEETTTLIHAGFLTLSGKSSTSIDRLFSPESSSKGEYLSSLAARGALSASGSIAASGGEGAIHEAGGSGGGRVSQINQNFQQIQSADGTSQTSDCLDLTLPGMGSYLKILTSATTHLLSLLARSKSRQAPMSLLKERWDGGVAGDDEVSRRRRMRNEFVDILPGRTRKWRQFNGISFEWVLEECVGRGLVEVFETGSVGKGVRRLG